MAITPPATLARPFAESGDKANIPDTTSTAGVASLTEGFPPVTQLPLSAGGIPPRRLDFNGMFNLLSQFAFWAQSGGQFRWNSALDYTSPCMVFGSDGKIYFGVAPSGPGYSGVGAKNPVTPANQGTYWVSLTGYALDPATTAKLGGIKVGDGFTITADGKLSVNPNSFSTELTAELMKQLRLPQWLTGNRTFYVRDSGNDNNDGGSLATAFLTIQGAINYIADNYNIGTFLAIIDVGSGVFDGFTMSPYQGTTGHLRITGQGETTIVSATDATLINSRINAGSWNIRNMRIKQTLSSVPGTIYTLHANTGTSLTLNDIGVDVKETAAGTGLHAVLGATGGGTTIIGNNVSIACEGDASSRIVPLYAYSGGSVNISADMSISGSGEIFAYSNTQGTIVRSNIAPRPVITGTFTGKRYDVNDFGVINVRGAGANYFPGTIAGTKTNLSSYS